MSPVVGFILIGILGCCTLGQELPADIDRCKVSDTVCMAKIATHLIKTHGNGRPDLGIPAFEPFRLNQLDLSDGSTGPVNLQLKLRDVVIHGLSGMEVEKIVGFDKDPETSKFEIYAKAKNLDLFGLYTADGRVLVVPVKGEGNFTMNIKNVKLSVKIKPTTVQKNGKTHLKVDKLKILIEPEDVKIELKRFIADSNPLGDSINDVINENWKQFWEEIYPPINEAILKIVKEILSEPLEKVAYDNIFLPE